MKNIKNKKSVAIRFWDQHLEIVRENFSCFTFDSQKKAPLSRMRDFFVVKLTNLDEFVIKSSIMKILEIFLLSFNFRFLRWSFSSLLVMGGK